MLTAYIFLTFVLVTAILCALLVHKRYLTEEIIKYFGRYDTLAKYDPVRDIFKVNGLTISFDAAKLMMDQDVLSHK